MRSLTSCAYSFLPQQTMDRYPDPYVRFQSIRSTFCLWLLSGLLADNIPISSTDFIVQIPASVGPPGCFYYLKATRYVREWNGDFQQCALEERTDSGWGAECPATVSNHFSLANATSQWIDFELDGRSRRWHMEYIPCDIYHAVRQGIDEFYDDHPAHLDDAAVDETIYDNIRECLAGLNDDVTAAITAAPIAVGGEIVTETTTTTTPSAPHVVPRAAQTPPENTTEVPTANTTLGYASPPHPIAAPTRPASEGIRPVSRWWTVFASFAIGQAVRIIFGYWPAMEFSSAGG